MTTAMVDSHPDRPPAGVHPAQPGPLSQVTNDALADAPDQETADTVRNVYTSKATAQLPTSFGRSVPQSSGMRPSGTNSDDFLAQAAKIAEQDAADRKGRVDVDGPDTPGGWMAWFGFLPDPTRDHGDDPTDDRGGGIPL